MVGMRLDGRRPILQPAAPRGCIAPQFTGDFLGGPTRPAPMTDGFDVSVTMEIFRAHYAPMLEICNDLILAHPRRAGTAHPHHAVAQRRPRRKRSLLQNAGLIRIISRCLEVVGALVRGEQLDDRADGIPQGVDCSLCFGAQKRRRLPRLHRTGPRPDPKAGRHRHHGQVACAQGGRGARRDRAGRRDIQLVATIQPRLQPDRERLQGVVSFNGGIWNFQEVFSAGKIASLSEAVSGCFH